MAVTITRTIQASINLISSGLSSAVSKSLTETSTGSDSIVEAQTIATGSWQAIGIGNCASADWILLLNTDTTNYVEVAIDSGGSNKIAKLSAGRFLILPLSSGVTLYAQANTAACVIQKAVVEP